MLKVKPMKLLMEGIWYKIYASKTEPSGDRREFLSLDGTIGHPLSIHCHDAIGHVLTGLDTEGLDLDYLDEGVVKVAKSSVLEAAEVAEHAGLGRVSLDDEKIDEVVVDA